MKWFTTILCPNGWMQRTEPSVVSECGSYDRYDRDPHVADESNDLDSQLCCTRNIWLWLWVKTMVAWFTSTSCYKSIIPWKYSNYWCLWHLLTCPNICPCLKSPVLAYLQFINVDHRFPYENATFVFFVSINYPSWLLSIYCGQMNQNRAGPQVPPCHPWYPPEMSFLLESVFISPSLDRVLRNAWKNLLTNFPDSVFI